MENIWNVAPSRDRLGGCGISAAKVDGGGVDRKTRLMEELVRR